MIITKTDIQVIFKGKSPAEFINQVSYATWQLPKENYISEKENKDNIFWTLEYKDLTKKETEDVVEFLKSNPNVVKWKTTEMEFKGNVETFEKYATPKNGK